MRIHVSRRVASMGSYAFAEVEERVAALRRRGIRPIDFGVGDPKDPAPECVRAACRRGVEERAASGYPSYVGSPEFREACAAWMERRFGVSLDPRTQISSTAGSKEAVFHLHEGFVDPGDVVIGPNPGYPPYARGTRFAEGEHHYYPLEPENGFLPDLDAISDETAERARIFWLCHPNSPTGTVVPPEELRRIVRWCREREILLASDEAYSEIYFDGEPPHSALEYGCEGVLAIFSLSKRSAMTGYRIGWVAGDERAVETFRRVKTNLDSGTPTFIQDAAIAALADEEHVRAFRESYREKRDLLVSAFRDLGLPVRAPAGALYLWQRTPEGLSAVEFARRLLAPDLALVVTPGTWLSEETGGRNPGEGFVRLALVPTLEETREAAERLRNAL